MQKRGQIYILASLILIFVIFTLTTIPNKLNQEELEKSFEKLSKNYNYESSRLINSFIATGITPFEEQFRIFTVQFTSFAKTQSLNFGLFYVLTFNGKTNLGNYLDVPITLQTSQGQSSLQGCYAKIPATIEFQGLSISSGDINMAEISQCTLELTGETQVVVNIEGVPYIFDLTSQGSKLLVLTRQEEGGQRLLGS